MKGAATAIRLNTVTTASKSLIAAHVAGTIMPVSMTVISLGPILPVRILSIAQARALRLVTVKVAAVTGAAEIVGPVVLARRVRTQEPAFQSVSPLVMGRLVAVMAAAVFAEPVMLGKVARPKVNARRCVRPLAMGKSVAMMAAAAVVGAVRKAPSVMT